MFFFLAFFFWVCVCARTEGVSKVAGVNVKSLKRQGTKVEICFGVRSNSLIMS